MAVDAVGDLFISETDFGYIVEVTPAGGIAKIAGNGNFTFSEDGLALNEAMNEPGGMMLDSHGDLYFGDVGNSRIRELIPDAPTQLSIGGGDGQWGMSAPRCRSRLL